MQAPAETAPACSSDAERREHVLDRLAHVYAWCIEIADEEERIEREAQISLPAQSPPNENDCSA